MKSHHIADYGLVSCVESYNGTKVWQKSNTIFFQIINVEIS